MSGSWLGVCTPLEALKATGSPIGAFAVFFLVRQNSSLLLLLWLVASTPSFH